MSETAVCSAAENRLDMYLIGVYLSTFDIYWP
jgi:hypothetical protein